MDKRLYRKNGETPPDAAQVKRLRSAAQQHHVADVLRERTAHLADGPNTPNTSPPEPVSSSPDPSTGHNHEFTATAGSGATHDLGPGPAAATGPSQKTEIPAPVIKSPLPAGVWSDDQVQPGSEADKILRSVADHRRERLMRHAMRADDSYDILGRYGH